MRLALLHPHILTLTRVLPFEFRMTACAVLPADTPNSAHPCNGYPIAQRVLSFCSIDFRASRLFDIHTRDCVLKQHVAKSDKCWERDSKSLDGNAYLHVRRVLRNLITAVINETPSQLSECETGAHERSPWFASSLRRAQRGDIHESRCNCDKTRQMARRQRI